MACGGYKKGRGGAEHSGSRQRSSSLGGRGGRTPPALAQADSSRAAAEERSSTPSHPPTLQPRHRPCPSAPSAWSPGVLCAGGWVGGREGGREGGGLRRCASYRRHRSRLRAVTPPKWRGSDTNPGSPKVRRSEQRRGNEDGKHSGRGRWEEDGEPQGIRWTPDEINSNVRTHQMLCLLFGLSMSHLRCKEITKPHTSPRARRTVSTPKPSKSKDDNNAPALIRDRELGWPSVLSMSLLPGESWACLCPSAPARCLLVAPFFSPWESPSLLALLCLFASCTGGCLGVLRAVLQGA